MKANAQEKAFYAQHALPGVPLAKAQVARVCGRLGVHSAPGPTHLPVLAAVSGGVTISRARMRKPGGSTSAIGRSDQGQLVGVADFGLRQPTHGVSLPAVYVPPTARTRSTL